jgi:hypothetical protein
LSGWTSIDPVLDPAEDHFHKDRLRANPAAEEATKNSRKLQNEDRKSENGENQQIQVVGPEDEAKKEETSP